MSTLAIEVSSTPEVTPPDKHEFIMADKAMAKVVLMADEAMTKFVL